MTSASLWRSLCAAFLLMLGCSFSTAGPQTASAAHGLSIVLVHGAFADGSSWSAVIRRLHDKGYNVTAVQNPLTSLKADVDAVQRVLSRQKGGVLLVGHSWAGAVITEAGMCDCVKGLVYLSALVPDRHESVAGLLKRLGSPMEGLVPDSEGLVWLDDPGTYRRVMAGDLRFAQARALAAVQQPIAATAFADQISEAAWRSKPSWYLLTEEDHALPRGTQARIAAGIGAQVSRLRSSHMSMVSQPDAVVRLIEQAAAAIVRQH